MLLSSARKDWLGNVRGDVLAGIVVALALIPEAIAFSIIAGVDPQVGLYSAFCIPIVMAFFGGRTAMISSSTGVMALLIVTLVKDHGLQYLLAASVMNGILQLLASYLIPGSLMRFVSRSVVTGFVNALAYGTTARAHKRHLARLCARRRRPGNHRPLSLPQYNPPLPAGLHRGADCHLPCGCI